MSTASTSSSTGWPRRVTRDRLARDGAEERPGDRRRVGDAAGGRIGLVLAGQGDRAGLAVLGAVGDAAAELHRRVVGVGRGQARGGVTQLPVAQVAAQPGGRGLVRVGGERRLDLGDPRLDLPQAAGGDEVRRRAHLDLGQRLGARAVVFLHECTAHRPVLPAVEPIPSGPARQPRAPIRNRLDRRPSVSSRNRTSWRARATGVGGRTSGGEIAPARPARSAARARPPAPPAGGAQRGAAGSCAEASEAANCGFRRHAEGGKGLGEVKDEPRPAAVARGTRAILDFAQPLRGRPGGRQWAAARGAAILPRGNGWRKTRCCGLLSWRWRSRGRRRRRGARRSTSSWCCSPTPRARSTRSSWRSSGAATPRRWSTRQVLAAIEAGGALGRIAVAYVEWASRRRQDVVVDWTVVDGRRRGAGLRRRLLAAPRRVKGVNAIGAALLKGVELIEDNRFDGSRKVIDLSGDSAWNPRRADARRGAGGGAATPASSSTASRCSATPCSGRQGAGNLEQQFTERVIAGPGAFVVTADGREAFAAGGAAQAGAGDRRARRRGREGRSGELIGSRRRRTGLDGHRGRRTGSTPGPAATAWRGGAATTGSPAARGATGWPAATATT